ncbi:MAG: hypothetical protein MUO76_12065, partial [Anaerolineaceae bacterium]|nr:hypothetical protein [Anaerolineaceae bacterium]
NWLKARIASIEKYKHIAYLEVFGKTISVHITKEGLISTNPGSEISVFCRPESLELVNGIGVWQVEIIDSMYISGTVQYRVRIGDIEWLVHKVAYPESEIWPRGSIVGIQVRKDAFQFIKTTKEKVHVEKIC